MACLHSQKKTAMTALLTHRLQTQQRLDLCSSEEQYFYAFADFYGRSVIFVKVTVNNSVAVRAFCIQSFPVCEIRRVGDYVINLYVFTVSRPTNGSFST